MGSPQPADDLDTVVAGLYRLPLTEFVAARDRLVRQLRVAGDRSAAGRVAALRRPRSGLGRPTSSPLPAMTGTSSGRAQGCAWRNRSSGAAAVLAARARAACGGNLKTCPVGTYGDTAAFSREDLPCRGGSNDPGRRPGRSACSH
jgi:hypothetical protein